MSKVIVQLFQYSCFMTIVAMLYMILFQILKKWYSAKTFYYAGILIIVGFIFPFRPVIPLPQLGLSTGNNLSSNDNVIQALLISSQNVLEQYSIDIKIQFAITSVMSSIWEMGVVVMMLYFVARHLSLRRMIKRWSVEITEPTIIAIFDNVINQCGVTMPICIKRCSCVSSPMLVGISKPTILLPEMQLSVEELEIIFSHEIEHFKRNDIAFKGLLMIAVALNWFNPFIYFFSQIFTYLCELSCDEAVSKNMDDIKRLQYVSIILQIAKKQTKFNTVFSTMFFGGEKNMKHRIFSIMNRSKKKISSSLLAICFALITSTGIVSATPQEFSYGIITAEAIAEEMDEAFSEKFPQEFNEADFPGMIITYDENGIPIVTDPTIYKERAVYATTIYPKNGFYTSSDCSDDSLLFYILQGQSVTVLDSSSYTAVAKVNYAGRDGYMKKYQLDF